MTLQEAIDEVKREGHGVLWTTAEVNAGGIDAPLSTAIATILNSVVKGELK